ncbi:hypothetical protein [Streptomyces sp. NPDC001274]
MSLVEAHGTGTSLGDPIDGDALVPEHRAVGDGRLVAGEDVGVMGGPLDVFQASEDPEAAELLGPYDRPVLAQLLPEGDGILLEPRLEDAPATDPLFQLLRRLGRRLVLLHRFRHINSL